MQTDIITPQELFSPERRLEAPLFQRPYVWDEEHQWAPLWEDVRAIAEAELAGARSTEHFLGAVVIQARDTGLTELAAHTIIDGQQRLTTLQLALDALGDVLEARDLTVQARRARRLTVNDVEPGSRVSERFKVWPTDRDQTAFVAVMDATSPDDLSPAAADSLLARAHDYFTARFEEFIDGDATPTGATSPTSPPAVAADERARTLLDALTRGLRMVVIRLTAEDDAQAIFETLNAPGTPLTAMDLVKNFLLQGLDPHSPSTLELYDRYWRPFEAAYWEAEIGVGRTRQVRSVAFLGWWLTARTGRVLPSRSVFAAFKRYTQGEGGGTVAVLEAISAAASRYADLDRRASTAHGELDELARLAYHVDVLGLDVLKPLLLWLTEPDQAAAPAEQRRRLITAVDSWIVRRALVKAPSTGMNRFVVEQLLRDAAAEPALMGERVESLLAAQDAAVSYWPDDDELRSALAEEPVYRTMNRARLRMVLETIEDHRRGYPDGGRRSEQPIVRGTCTVEHLLTQQWRLNWDDGADELTAAGRDQLLHTLGNLTLVTQALNSSLSNGAWDAKQRALAASTSLLITHEILRDHPTSWTDDDVRERTRTLTEEIVAIWPAPPGHVHRAPAATRTLTINSLTLRDLLGAGLLTVGAELVGTGPAGTPVTAVVDDAGRLTVDGAAYEYPTTAAREAAGVPTSGWAFWHVGSPDGPVLDELRAELLGALGTPAPATSRPPLPDWNGRDWYLSFGEDDDARSWEDARRYGFVSAGGGVWYSRTLRNVPVGSRVLVCVPHAGYVAVGTTTGPAVPFAQASVDVDGVPRPLTELPLAGSYRVDGPEDEREWVLPARWEHAVPRCQAVWEPGWFANQNSAARLRSTITIEGVLRAFGLDAD